MRNSLRNRRLGRAVGAGPRPAYAPDRLLSHWARSPPARRYDGTQLGPR